MIMRSLYGVRIGYLRINRRKVGRYRKQWYDMLQINQVGREVQMLCENMGRTIAVAMDSILQLILYTYTYFLECCIAKFFDGNDFTVFTDWHLSTKIVLSTFLLSTLLQNLQ